MSLCRIDLVRIGSPNVSAAKSEQHRTNLARNAAFVGANEATDRIALIAFEGQHYIVGFGLLRYGADWRISAQASPIAGTPAFGAPLKVTPEEFDKMVVRRGP